MEGKSPIYTHAVPVSYVLALPGSPLGFPIEQPSLLSCPPLLLTQPNITDRDHLSLKKLTNKTKTEQNNIQSTYRFRIEKRKKLHKSRIHLKQLIPWADFQARPCNTFWWHQNLKIPSALIFSLYLVN